MLLDALGKYGKSSPYARWPILLLIKMVRRTGWRISYSVWYVARTLNVTFGKIRLRLAIVSIDGRFGRKGEIFWFLTCQSWRGWRTEFAWLLKRQQASIDFEYAFAQNCSRLFALSNDQYCQIMRAQTTTASQSACCTFICGAFAAATPVSCDLSSNFWNCVMANTLHSRLVWSLARLRTTCCEVGAVISTSHPYQVKIIRLFVLTFARYDAWN